MNRWSDLSPRKRSRIIRWCVYLVTLAAIMALALLIDWPGIQRTFFDAEIAREQFPEVVTQAAKNTLIFTAFGFVIAFGVGLLLAVMRLSDIAVYRAAALIWIEIFRGLPALVTISLIGFGLPIALGQQFPGTYTTGSIAVGVVGSAYIAETVRAGIEAVPKGQMEAARSLGMSYGRAMVTVIIPQALRVVIPPLTNEFVLLLKDTSLLSVLGVTASNKELLKFARDDAVATFNSTPYVVVGLVYLAITVPLTFLARRLEAGGSGGGGARTTGRIRAAWRKLSRRSAPDG
jgi:polar amino acid transport system permease protein